MSSYSDNGLKRVLKNWAAEKEPPRNGRAELISQAAIIQRRKFFFPLLIPRIQFNELPVHNTNEWSQSLLPFFFAQSIHAGFLARP
jgi:hypothetical protein